MFSQRGSMALEDADEADDAFNPYLAACTPPRSMAQADLFQLADQLDDYDLGLDALSSPLLPQSRMTPSFNAMPFSQAPVAAGVRPIPPSQFNPIPIARRLFAPLKPVYSPPHSPLQSPAPLTMSKPSATSTPPQADVDEAALWAEVDQSCDRLDLFGPSGAPPCQQPASAIVKPVTLQDMTPPKPRTNSVSTRIPLVPTTDVGAQYKKLFKFPVFNAMQSSVFHSVFETSDNLVITAPTGSGKTVVFELAMLRQLKQEPDAKMVYIAPTKSLCSERVADWKKKFENELQIACAELTGDTSADDWASVRKASIIITTPEKWDATTRMKAINSNLLTNLRLVCIDELHILNEDRGATLEVIVSRMRALATATRFVAVSATCPNTDDVASWIGGPAGSPATVQAFGPDFRPCPLKRFVYGYPKQGKNSFAFDASLNQQLMSQIKAHSEGKATLIFCNTRKSTTQAADQLFKEFAALQQKNARTPWRPDRGRELRFSDPKLKQLSASGIAYHHAGLSPEDRRRVEAAFISGQIKVLATTTTLAVGVNLPARLVVIRGTDQYDPSVGSRPYSCSDMLQMIGRAGRPAFDTCGVAVILTSLDQKTTVESILENNVVLESTLHKNLTEHICSEISLGTIATIEQVIQWLHTTFLWQRMQKNPQRYDITTGTSQTPADRLQEIVLQNIDALRQDNLCDVASLESSASVESTALGKIMSRYFLGHSSFRVLNALQHADTKAVLLALSSAREFEQLRIRQAEKSVYSTINKREDIRWPIPKVTKVSEKIATIIQVVLGGVPMSEIATEYSSEVPPMAVQVSLIWKDLPRLAKGLVEVAIEKQDGLTLKSSLEILRSIVGKAWENTPTVLRQLKNIGEKHCSSLAAKGISTIADIAKVSPHRIEMILNRNPPFGTKVRDQARSIPVFSLGLVLRKENVTAGGIQVSVEVTVAMQTDPQPVYPPKSSATVLVLTSDNMFVNFTRVNLNVLQYGSKTYTVHTTLVKPSQKIVAFVSCEKFAGIEVMNSIAPASGRHVYPVPSFSGGDAVAGSSTEAGADNATKQSQTGSQQVPVPQRNSMRSTETRSEAAPSSRPRAKRRHSEVDNYQGETEQLPNGNWRCNHSCKDRTACRHLCCREGLAKPPKKKRAKQNVAAAAAPTDQWSDDGMSGIRTIRKRPEPPKNTPSASKTKAKSDQRIDAMLSSMHSKQAKKIKIYRIKNASPAQRPLVGVNMKKKAPATLFAAFSSETTSSPSVKQTPTNRFRRPTPIELDSTSTATPPSMLKVPIPVSVPGLVSEEEIDELASDNDALPPGPALTKTSSIPMLPIEAHSEPIASNSLDCDPAAEFMAWLHHNVKVEG